MNSPTLLILAAGMGSRYGGLKQMDPVGPSGEILLDYAVFDALRSGFGRVVFVIRPDFAEAFEKQVSAKYRGSVAIDLVFQTLDRLPAGFSVPEGRLKPWGTGHAVWCAREAIDGPFMAIGADDFFGRDSFERLGEFLRRPDVLRAPPHRFAMAGYRLDRTLSEHGTVSRGVCSVQADGFLRTIDEHTAIDRAHLAASGLKGDEIVSMNCFGFTSGLFPSLDAQFRAFLSEHGRDAKREFYLPAAVSHMIARGEATVQVLPVTGEWFGVTHREEKPRVEAALAALVSAGVYPTKLF